MYSLIMFWGIVFEHWDELKEVSADSWRQRVPQEFQTHAASARERNRRTVSTVNIDRIGNEWRAIVHFEQLKAHE